MVWKCPKCKHTSPSYMSMMKHFYKAHPTPKKLKAVSKGKQKKRYTFHPPKRRK